LQAPRRVTHHPNYHTGNKRSSTSNRTHLQYLVYTTTPQPSQIITTYSTSTHNERKIHNMSDRSRYQSSSKNAQVQSQPTGDTHASAPRPRALSLPRSNSTTVSNHHQLPTLPRRIQVRPQASVPIPNMLPSQGTLLSFSLILRARHILTLNPAVQSDVNHYDSRLYIARRQEEAIQRQRQLHRFGLLVLLALLFIPLGYIVTRISEAKAMDILQIMAVFAVEAVRIFSGI
jgi:hypothetical protein